MKKMISLFLSILILFSISLSGYALNDNATQAIHIPSPTEIQEQYKALSIPQSQADSSNPSVDMLDPIMNVGVMDSIAQANNDLSVLADASETIFNEIMPSFSTGDYLTVLENAEYTPAFRFAIMDMYGYLPMLERENISRSTPVDSAQVDAALAEYVVPGEELSISAIAAIQDKTVIGADKLTRLVSSGSEDEQKVALRALCEAYPDEARAQVRAILEQGFIGSDVYRSAIRFMPRLVDENTNFTQGYVLSEIEAILDETDDYLVQMTCVKVLTDIDTQDALALMQKFSVNLPSDLVNYFVNHSGQSEAAALITPEVRGASMRKGNALYRDGVLGGLQWHTGIVAHQNGPKYQNGKYVIHHPGSFASSPKIVRYDTFTTFLDNEQFIAECYMSGVSNSVYQNICAIGDDLVSEGIPYTALTLMTANKELGKIEPRDITKIRCDGVVEYCYEYNGVRLQGGTRTWDISQGEGLAHHQLNTMSPKGQRDYFDRTVPYD